MTGDRRTALRRDSDRTARANRRLIIIFFILAGVLYTVGFALTGQQAARNRDLARQVKVQADKADQLSQYLSVSLTLSAKALRTSQLDACERGNNLRAESNRRLKAHIVDRDVLLDALRLAAKGRGPAARPFAVLRDRERSGVHFKKLRTIDCQKVIPEVPQP